MLIKQFLLGAVLVITGWFVFPGATQAQTIITFERDDCTHCQDLQEYLDSEPEGIKGAMVVKVDIDQQPEAWEQFQRCYQLPRVTPLIVANSTIIEGFGTVQSSGPAITSALTNTSDPFDQVTDPLDLLASCPPLITLADQFAGCEVGETGQCTVPAGLTVATPWGTQVDPKQYSLPVLSLILGIIDGFNPCAMWVLLTFVVLLSQVGDRRKLIAMVGAFLLAEAIMYYLILTLWYQTWDFIGLDRVVTPLVGTLALAAGLFFLYQFIKHQVECRVSNLDQRAKTRSMIKEIIEKPLTIATFVGIVGIALSVNIVEFACSIGIPQTFTKILELNDLSLLGTQSMLWMYIFGYMLDDVVVFGLAAWGFSKLQNLNSYTRWSHLIGGLLMLVLGLIMLLQPGWLG